MLLALLDVRTVALNPIGRVEAARTDALDRDPAALRFDETNELYARQAV